ncbi:MAG: DUF1015 domain-containing protein [Clostridia bacterium]|nr:DUF1015 domain-containing protein [Clostridia bacterium]
MRTIKCVDILLPRVAEPEKWAVVSCDQFTSQRDYWQTLESFVGDAPSTLRLIFPEVYLEDDGAGERTEKINCTMKEYLAGNVFHTLKDSFILVKRDTELRSRLGLIVAIVLEDYSYNYPTEAPLRATEGVVADRIPPRLKIRRDAPIELPHILVVMDDRKGRVIEDLYAHRDSLEKLYDFDLNMKGGHLTGYRVDKDQVFDRLALYEKDIDGLYGVRTDFTLAVGDGNHSLATAQAHWNEIKVKLTEEERESHPARFALCELENLHDSGIAFEPIHRVVFDVDNVDFVTTLRSRLNGGGKLEVVCGDNREMIACNHIGAECIAEVQKVIDEYIAEKGGTVDYIHGTEHLLSVAKGKGGVAIFMPTIKKDELFQYVVDHGNLSRKSFSMGEAEEKRYYYECHKIVR